MSTETSAVRLPLQPFSIDPTSCYPIEIAARLSQMPRHVLLACCRRGMISPCIDPESGALCFHRKDIQTLQNIEYLRSGCGANLAGIQIILELLDEVRELHALLHD